MEYNKGNATAGLLSSQGLLTDLTDVAKKRGWDKKLAPSLQTTARYDDKGVMGSGKWYGVPNYGEFVTVYYNKDMFAAHNIAVPTTLAELTADMDKFVAAGVTPLAMAGAEYPAGQLYYELALSKADRAFVDAYQMYKGKVDFQADPLKYGADTFDEWVKKGYIAKDSGEPQGRGHGRRLHQRQGADDRLRQLVVRPVRDRHAKKDWGIFNFPGNKLNAGSSGQPLGGPGEQQGQGPGLRLHRHHDAARDPGLLGNNGGLPVAADPRRSPTRRARSSSRRSTRSWTTTAWRSTPTGRCPATTTCWSPASSGLINQSKTPDQVLGDLGKAYDDGVANIGHHADRVAGPDRGHARPRAGKDPRCPSLDPGRPNPGPPLTTALRPAP